MIVDKTVISCLKLFVDKAVMSLFKENKKENEMPEFKSLIFSDSRTFGQNKEVCFTSGGCLE